MYRYFNMFRGSNVAHIKLHTFSNKHIYDHKISFERPAHPDRTLTTKHNRYNATLYTRVHIYIYKFCDGGQARQLYALSCRRKKINLRHN